MSEQSGFIGGVEAVSAAIDRVAGWLCALLFGAMTMVVLLGVFFRFVMNSPLSWPEEASRYLMIWGSSVAVSMGVRADEHVGLTILLEVFKAKAPQLILRTLIFLCVMAFLVFMFVYSLQLAFESEARQTLDLGISMLLPTLAVPLSMFLAAVQLILSFVVRLGGGSARPREQPVAEI